MSPRQLPRKPTILLGRLLVQVASIIAMLATSRAL